ncbi:hypothetical protein [uncultured Clostridium sp.]|uniref:hypothetical protein n=1 Tax=uncultured Clostridium sp. TaxID=59620 RepID=UPI0026210EC3|nr:hypothetical protein [uncultured Clostridium sp.]
MIINKEENLDLDLTSYKSKDIKAFTRKLVYNKDVSAEPIGFLCFLIPVIVSIIFSFIGIIFFRTSLISDIGNIVTLIFTTLLLGYAFMKSIQVIKKKKVTIKYIFNPNVIFIFFLIAIIFSLIAYFLYEPVSHLLMYLMKSNGTNNNLNSLQGADGLLSLAVNSLILLSIKELIKNIILYFLAVILFLVIFNIFVFPAYISASKDISLLNAFKSGFKLSFKNMFKLLKIEFSFIHILIFLPFIQPLFIWKGLYIFTSISLVIEKSLQEI